MRPSNPSADPRDRRSARRRWAALRRAAARSWSGWRGLGDAGNAALEFIVAGLVLLVPTVYLIVTLGLIQEQALGVEAGARHIARAVATSADSTAANAAADTVLASVTDEYGMDPSSVTVSTTCLPGGGPCPQAGATLIVTVTARVALPLVPPVLGLDRIAFIPVQAVSAQKVSRFWEGG